MSKELHLTQEQDFEKFRHAYRAAIKEVRIKIEILSEDFAVRHDYNPIHHMERRLKATESIEEKLHRLGKEVSIKSARENIHDIAGIRVVCNFIDDVYTVADMLLGQNDVRLIEKKRLHSQSQRNRLQKSASGCLRSGLSSGRPRGSAG